MNRGPANKPMVGGKYMKKAEALFLLAVLIFTGVFVAGTLSHVTKPAVAERESEPPLNAAGVPRDVDMEKLKGLLLHRYLSDREAEFYEPVPTEKPRDRPKKDEAQDMPRSPPPYDEAPDAP